MKTVVIDPRRIGIGAQADMLLQPRPGTDGALALALIHCLMEKAGTTPGLRAQWTNGSFLLNAATNDVSLKPRFRRAVRAESVRSVGRGEDQPAVYDPSAGNIRT